MSDWPNDLDEREAEWERDMYDASAPRPVPGLDALLQRAVGAAPRWTMTREGAEHLGRLAVAGSVVAPQPIRRRYGRDLLGLIGIIIVALGIVALGMLWERM